MQSSFLSEVARSRATHLRNSNNISHGRIFSTKIQSSLSTKPKFDVELYLAEKRKALKKAVEEAIPIRKPKELYESMRYNILSGRMIAPLMCIAACELVGGHQQAVMPAASAVQMAIYMAVMHDDLPCIDDSHIRSGKPTNHKVYGDSVTLLAGDALGVLAFQHLAIATKGVTPERTLRAVFELGKAVGPDGLQAGQVADVLARGAGSLEDLEFVNLHKCGALFSGIFVIGGIIGGATDEEVETLRFCGEKIGLMFQLIDDVADIDEDTMNKHATYPLLIGIEQTKELAAKLNKDAHDGLAEFDQDKAAPLIALMDHCLSDVC